MNKEEFEKRPENESGDRVVPLRLQKYLARAGVASRRASENLMTAGRVTVNGQVVRELGSKVDPLVDVIAVDGKIVEPSHKPVTIMLNKPEGVITTMKAQSDKPIVAEYVPLDTYPALYPLGRLDSDTTGLLLFSTDGNLGNLLLHPSHHVPKTYEVIAKHALTKGQIDLLSQGVMLDDGMTQPAEVLLDSVDSHKVYLTIHEGRYHQVKRMLEAVGNKVVHLHRSKFGPLTLEGLDLGKWRYLTEEEVASLKEAVL